MQYQLKTTRYIKYLLHAHLLRKVLGENAKLWSSSYFVASVGSRAKLKKIQLQKKKEKNEKSIANCIDNLISYNDRCL